MSLDFAYFALYLSYVFTHHSDANRSLIYLHNTLHHENN
jgi:hypothetical protein